MGLGNSYLERLLLFFGESQRLGMFLVGGRFGVSVAPVQRRTSTDLQTNAKGARIKTLDVHQQILFFDVSHLELVLGRELFQLVLGVPTFCSTGYIQILHVMYILQQ